jgi:hypothetical protein
MNVPTIGGARGIFEIFVPGLFLLLNLVGVAYLLPFMDQDTKHFIESGAANPGLSLVIVISFGYLMGVVLRLVPPDVPDRLSSEWLKRSGSEQDGDDRRDLSADRFPYTKWMGNISSKRLPPDVYDFYKATWGHPNLEPSKKTLFNFMKVFLSDERAKGEIYAAEALTRYISGMFYALSVSFLCIVITGAACLFAGRWIWGLALVLVAYGIGWLQIVRRFRVIRVKEVEAVFAASYRNRSLFQRMLEDANGAQPASDHAAGGKGH